jgi:hypothetical protein
MEEATLNDVLKNANVKRAVVLSAQACKDSFLCQKKASSGIVS